MNKTAKILIITAAVAILAGIATGFAYKAHKDAKFEKMMGVSEQELREELNENAHTLHAYLKTRTTDAEAKDMVALLQAQPWAKTVAYISPDEALAEFKQKHASDPTINEALAELSKNPLLGSIQLHLKECTDAEVAAKFIADNDGEEIITRVIKPSIGCADIEKRIETLKQVL